MDIIKFIQFPAAVAKVYKLDGYGSINYKVSLADETNYLVKIYDASQKNL